MRVLLGITLLLSLTAGALRLPWPFVWIAAVWAVALLALALRARTFWGRLIALSLLAPTVVLGALEVALQVRRSVPGPTRFEGTNENEALWRDHAIFGYGPVPGLVVTARRIVDGEVAYELTYRYDEHGQRIPPPVEAEPPAGAIACVGGSFTLGEGVGDEETYPYRIGELSGRRYEVRNFGFHGYGPHHALAALEAGWVDEVCDSAPVLVLYLAIPDHLPRCAGHKWWDGRGPHYRLAEGEVVREGSFNERPPPPLGSETWLRHTIRRSAIGRCYVGEPGGQGREETELYQAIVTRMRDEVVRRFPGAELHVLAWSGSAHWWSLMERLRSAGVAVHRVDAMLPGLAPGAALPTIPGDPHPTPEVYDAIARYVVSTLLR